MWLRFFLWSCEFSLPRESTGRACVCHFMTILLFIVCLCAGRAHHMHCESKRIPAFGGSLCNLANQNSVEQFGFVVSFYLSHTSMSTFLYIIFFFFERRFYMRDVFICARNPVRFLWHVRWHSSSLVAASSSSSNTLGWTRHIRYMKIFSFFFQRAFLLGRNHVDLFCFVNSHVGGIRVRGISACRCRSKCQTGLSSTSLITWSVLCD